MRTSNISSNKISFCLIKFVFFIRLLGRGTTDGDWLGRTIIFDFLTWNHAIKSLDPLCIPLYRNQYFNILNRFRNFIFLKICHKFKVQIIHLIKSRVSHKNQSKWSKTVNGLILRNKISIPQAWPYCQHTSIASIGLV